MKTLGVTTSSGDDVEGGDGDVRMKPFVFMNMSVEEGKEADNIAFDMSFDEFRSLHKELKAVRKKMLTT